MSESNMAIQISELKDMISQLNITIRELTKHLTEKDTALEELKTENALMRSKLYGSSKERLHVSADADQLNFFWCL